MAEIPRALVVDDDPIARKTVRTALEHEGFHCDLAVDGEDALAQLDGATYNLVVTDLQMPKKHGHALSVELLQRDPRPLIVVHSCIDDPGLTKDLMKRGVDDIVYKPTNYAAFAAKVKGLVRHRQTQATKNLNHQHHSGDARPATKAPNCGEQEERRAMITQKMPSVSLVPMSDIENKLSLVSRILPLSNTALDVYQMTRTGCDAIALGAAIQRDAALVAEVLSIANSNFYNPSGTPITELDQAVVKIGQQRIGELALAAVNSSALAERKLWWMNVPTMWRQSIAAGVAVEHLVEEGQHAKIGNGLVLNAIMNSLGRVVLGTLYPNQYGHMFRQSTERDAALIELEKSMFPENHARIISRLFSMWNIPDQICRPMNYILEPYASLRRLAEPTRTQVELVKVAAFIGRVATGAWHSWDQVEIPPASVLERLQIHDIEQILEQTRNDTQAIVEFKSDVLLDSTERTPPKPTADRVLTIYYENLSALPFDFIVHLIRGMDIEITSATSSCKVQSPRVVINCVGVSEHDPPPTIALPSGVSALIVTDREDPPEFGVNCEVLKTPVSWNKLRSALVEFATEESRSTPTTSTTGYSMPL